MNVLEPEEEKKERWMYNDGDVLEAIIRLGVDGQERNNEITATCPMHFELTGKYDHNPSWSINKDSGIHHCFSCGYKGTLLGLVCDVLKIDREEAKRWLRQYTQIDVELTAKRLEELKEAYVSPVKPVPMSEARLAIYDEPPHWALEVRGLSAKACADYSVKWSNSESAWILPIRTPEGDLLGWQEKGQGNRYFKNRPAGVEKSRSLFGYEALDPSHETILVVESPLDVVKVASWGYYIGVAIYGAVISDFQLNLLRSAKTLIFAFDNPAVDQAGNKAFRDLVKRARKAGIEYFVYNYEDETKDIGDMTQEQFESGLVTARHCSLSGIGMV